MSNTTDAKLVIETLLGRTMTNEALTRVADAYLLADPHSLVKDGTVVLADPNNPTADEKAQLFLLTLKRSGQSVVGNVSDNVSDDSAAAAKEAARLAAIADME